MGVKGADDIDSDLTWCPFVTIGGAVVPDSVFTGAEQHELGAGADAGAGAGTAVCWFAKDLFGPEQHEDAAATGTGGAGAGVGTEQQEDGAVAGTLRSTGSVVTCNPRATRSW